MLFCASLAPCEKARPAAVKNWAPRRRRLTAGVARVSSADSSRLIRNPAQKPISGDRSRAASTLTIPVTWPWKQLAEAPDHVIAAHRNDDRPGQTADQRVRRGGGNPEIPGDEVPDDGAEQPADQDRQRKRRQDAVQRDELADGVGHRRAAEQRAEKFEDADDDDRLHRRHGARGDHGGDDVGGVVKAVGVIEQQHDDDRDDRQENDGINHRADSWRAQVNTHYVAGCDCSRNLHRLDV